MNRIVLCILVAIAAAAGGLFFGLNFDRDTSEDQEAVRAERESKPRMIAAVNLDEGVSVDGINQMYSTAIIESLGSVFSLTSYQAALKGFTDGAYDAIVVFPSDFSQKVSSVNAVNPQKIAIDYQIGENLSEKIYIETFRIIDGFQIEVNRALSYMYLVSLYDELHGAQDNVGKLLSNDEKVLVAIEELNATNFTNNLKLGDMPQIKMDFQSMVLQDSIKNVDSYANDMSAVYLNSYDNAQTAYQNLTTQLADDVSETKDTGELFSNSIAAWTNSAEGWFSSAQTYQSDLENYGTGMEAWRVGSNAAIKDYQDFKTNFDSIVIESENCRNAMVTIAEKIYDTLEKLLATDYFTYTDAYRVALDEYYDELVNYSGPPSDAPKFEDDAGRKAAYNNYFSLAPSIGTVALEDILNARAAAVSAHAPDPLILDKNAIDTLTGLQANVQPLAQYNVPPPDATTVPPLTALPVLDGTDFSDKVDAVEATAFSYDPLAYLTRADQANAENIMSQYSTEIGRTQSELDKLVGDHFEMVTGAYTEYSQYVGDLRTSVFDAYTDELKQVSSAKDAFVDIGKTTSAENRILFSAFAAKMPNTRSGQEVNRAVAEFVAAPVALTHADIRAWESSDVQSGGVNFAWIILLIGIAAVIAIIILLIVHQITSKRAKARTR